MNDFRYINYDKIRFHVDAIYKDIYSSKYLEEITKELSALLNDDSIDGYVCKRYIYAIAQELVYSGFKFTSDGFPIPSNWKVPYDVDVPIKEWLLRATPSLKLKAAEEQKNEGQ